MIRAYLDHDHKKWDLHLDDSRFAYNTAKHSVTNMTPAFLNLERELEPRTSLLQQVEQGAEVVPFSPQDWIERLERVKNIRDWVTRKFS